MWSTSEEPPGGTAEGGELPESVVHAKEKCEQNKNQLESLKEIMLKNKQSLKKKEEEVQEYARRLSKIKSRAKLSRRSKDESLLPCKDVSHTAGIGASTIEDTSEEAVEDISQAKTAKAKSTLLQKKLAENRKVFEQRSKEITETKRAVEEKVEAIRQQLEEKDVTATGFQKDHQLPVVIPVQPVMISTDIMSPTQIESIQEKENQIMVLNNRILELEATVVDLQENLKEKDSVIESKTRAVTLMSADLSKKGKTTLDTLEETKDEMRTMQEHFVLLESSLKNKNENLLAQLQGRDDRIAELEDSIKRLEEEQQQQQQQQQSYQSGGNADVPRSTTLDTLLETKEVMKSMQENFILIESSLKAKNDHLLEQLNDYELKLAEANERILKLESGAGIIKDPTVDDLQYKLDKLERNNKQLQDEKYELQKNIAELQDKVLNLSVNGNNGALIEKDNRIVELENLIEELKQSNKLLEEESKAELQQKLADLSLKNEEYSNKVSDLESLVHELEEQKSDMAARLSDESALKEEDKVAKLSKELEELNKSMIKIKAQHRSKVKNLQKQLENVKKVSDTNAELVRLGNQVALLEEEKGNLQLSLVDFDELKASAGDWQERVVDLESKVSAQTKEIEMQIEAIATLENQKLDLMQELHAAKQEISSLEAENAESENLRVTAEMKVVDLEEELEAVHKLETSSTSTTTTTTTTTTEANQVAEQLLKQVEALSQENAELYNRIAKLEEKGTSESSSGSTESFEAIQELDKSDLLKKIEDLMHKNNELTVKVSRYQEEKENAHTVGSTEWTLETMNEREKNDESKKIEEQLTEENGDLTAMKLGRIEEKGSSDTGSTESFERIPEHSESAIKIELLTAENYELVVKCTKLEEQLDHWEYKYDKLYAERTGVVSNLLETHRENEQLEKEIESLTKERNELAAALRGRSEDRVSVSDVETVDSAERVVKRSVESEAADSETELTEEKEKQSRDATRDERIDELKKKIELLTAENYELVVKCTKREEQLDHSEYKYDNLYAERNGVLGNIVKIAGENDQLEEKIESLTKERNELAAALRGKSEDRVSVSDVETVDSAERVVKRSVESEAADSETELTEEKEKQSRDRTRDERIDELKKKIELLTAENYELVIKCTKRKEQLDHWEYKYGNLYEEMDGVLGNIVKIAGENDQLKEKIESLTKEKNELAAGLQGKSEDRVSVSDVERIVKRSVDTETESMEEKGVYDARYETLDVRGIEELNARIEELLKDNERVLSKLSDVETYNQKLKEDLTEMTREKEKLQERINEISRDDSVKEKLLDSEKKSVVVVEGEEEITQSDDALGQQTDRSMIVVASLEREIEECRKLIAEQTGLIEEMKIKLAKKEEELEEKGKQLVEYEASGKKAERLENELKEMFGTIEEWKYKCSEMQEKMEKLEAGKVSIEEGLKMLQNENQMLLEEKREKLAESDQLKQQLQDTVRMFESKVEEQLAVISEKEQEISNLRRSIEDKDEELHSRYTELQNKMITIDRLQDECNNCKMSIQEKNSALTTMSDEVANLGNVMKSKEEEIYSLRRHIEQLKERVEDSKPLKDYNELLEQLKKKDTVLDELDCRMNATTKEKSNLSEKVKSLSQQYNNIQSELSEKQKELVDTIATKEQLEALIGESRKERDKAEGQISELQSMIDNNGKLVENLKAELEDRFKEIEELKVKHTEDVELQNQRLKNLMEELNSRTEECERLRDELEEKEQQLVGPSMTEEAKVALEGKIADLEEKLKESEDKIHSQLEKMKKLAANLKKKAMVCQELESRVTELEEKWTTEKDEKEAKNKQIQDVEMAMREKDNRIAELEEKLIEAKNENVEALKNIDRLTSDLRNSKEKMTLVTQQLEEMEQEIGKLRADLESRGAELASERESRERIVSDYDSYRQRVLGENERKQVELEEAKEKARELSVRMQVMEAEYVEQLALIKNLQAESGLLLSKQAQINEKLENVEKESEERRLLIEQMQGTSTTESVTESSTQTTEEEEGAQRCGHCNQCQTLVQALEAKLQEREAEIENLKNHNELANSRVTVGNCVPMNTETGLAEITLRRDPYTELLSEFHTETARHELVKAELAEALKENKELIEKMEEMTTTTTTTEQSLKGSRAEEGEAALRELQQRLTSQASLLESAEESEKNLQKEIGSLKSEKERKEKLIEDLRSELEGYRNQSRELVEKKSIAKREAVASDSQQDNVPRLFDASKIFGSSFASDSDLLTTDSETKRLHALLEEKEAQCTNLTEEIGHLQRLMMEERSQMSQNYSQCMEELDVSRKQLTVALTNLERLEETLSERDEQIDALNGELENLNRNDSKGMQLEELRASLNSTREALDAIIVERDQHNALLESYKLQINHLEAELKNSSLTDSELIQELENRVSLMTKERDLLQLQVNDLSRSMEEMRYSTGLELEKVSEERDEAKEEVGNLTRALEDAYKRIETASVIVDTSSSKESSAPLLGEGESPATRKEAVVEETADASWDAEKLNVVDEEGWGWDADDAQLVGEHVAASLIPSTEMQLRAKLEDLEDRMKEMEKERERMLEESEAVQLRNGKMIKKLKEYKVQMERLQQQLKTQKSSSDFYGLDSAIEEELKCQIGKLEKSLSQLREELKNAVAEKEALAKRFDVVVSANERYMEMKERQDMDMEVLRIRNKELSDKVEALDRKLQSVPAEHGGDVVTGEEKRVLVAQEPLQKGSVDAVDADDYEQGLRKKYREEIDDLKEEMEALATENELLQHFLEEQKIKLSDLEKKRTLDENESIQIVDDLNNKISEMQAMLSKSREEYDSLRKQYEQSLMDANDQVTAMRQNTDFLKEEAREKIGKLEAEVADLRQQLEPFESRNAELQRRLLDAVQEKASLEERLASSEKQLSSANSSMAEVTDLLNIRIQEVADLKQELQRQYVDHEEAKTKLQESVEELNQELGEKKQQVESLKQSLSEKEKDESVQQQSVETVSALVSQATQELVQKHAIEAEEKEKQVQSLQGKLNEYSFEKENILSRFAAQQQELELLRQNLAERNSIFESVQANMTEKERELVSRKERIEALGADNQSLLETIGKLQQRLYEFESSSVNVNGLMSRIQSLEATLMEKESDLARFAEDKVEIDALRNQLTEKTEQINWLSSELEATRKLLQESRQVLNEKSCLLEKCNRMLEEKEMESNRASGSTIVDGLPLFRMTDENQGLQQQSIDAMQIELEKKQEEIDHLKYVLNESTYPGIIREMQDTINCLYDEKAELLSSLDAINRKLEEKEKEIVALTERLKAEREEVGSTEQARERASMQHDQEKIVRLQNELHAKEQEMNELRYVIAEKDSQLSLQASMEPQSDEFELRETVQRLTGELYGKEQEVQQLKLALGELRSELAALQQFQRLSEESRDAIEKLAAEKEQVRLEAQELLERTLGEKEAEIEAIKQRLSMENQRILEELQLRDRDVENLKKQMEESLVTETTTKYKLEEKEEELVRVGGDLAEKERRLAELSITKDAELHNFKVQIQEKEARIEELMVLSDQEEKQLKELKNVLEARETEINSLKKLLEDKAKELELIENVLKKDVSVVGASTTSERAEGSDEENKAFASQELDLALYMLHQRDVRCEELTHELMQLLEERDTLQLRLSNAIRVNEELRRTAEGGGGSGGPDVASRDEPSTSVLSEEPVLVEHPSPSKSEGPVEIAKEAIDAPIGEDKQALALKLSQLHTVSHAKDVRLRDERELRHTQQMSLLAHKDVLSTLPPEAAARLVNANYTLSRDVQSQSSVLLNWLWGKSTPKVVHM